MSIIEVLQTLWNVLYNLLSKYYGLIVIAVAGIGAFCSLRAYRNVRRIKVKTDEIASMVSRIQDVVDNRMEEFTRNLLDGYRFVKELKEKIESLRGA